MMPGMTYLPVPSMIVAPAGAERFLPMRAILPFSSRMSVFSIVPLVTGHDRRVLDERRPVVVRGLRGLLRAETCRECEDGQRTQCREMSHGLPPRPPRPRPPPAGAGALGVIIRPSTNTSATLVPRSNRSPLATVRFAIFPGSIEPVCSATPKICAGAIVSARTAWSWLSPAATALDALPRKSNQLVMPPDSKAKRTPAADSLPATLGAFTRASRVRSGSGGAPGAGACVTCGKSSDNSTGMFAAASSLVH